MPPQTSAAGAQSPANEARERQIRNISAVYRIAGEEPDQPQTSEVGGSSGDALYTNPADRSVALQDNYSAAVGEIFDSMM